MFPHLGRHVIRIGREGFVVDSDALEPFAKARD